MKKVFGGLLVVIVMVVVILVMLQDIVVVVYGQVNDLFWLVVKNGVEEVVCDIGINVEYCLLEIFDMVVMLQLIDVVVN